MMRTPHHLKVLTCSLCCIALVSLHPIYCYSLPSTAAQQDERIFRFTEQNGNIATEIAQLMESSRFLRGTHHISKRTVPLLLPFQTQSNAVASKPNPQEEHDRAAASSIFKNLLRLAALKTNSTIVPNELTFQHGQAIATIYTKPIDDTVHCNLIEVLTPEENDRALKSFSQRNQRVLQTSFRTILAIITACQALDEDSTADVKREKSNSFIQFMVPSTVTTGPSDNVNGESIATGTGERVISQSPPPQNMWSVVSGILPGTKWCGLGDIARNYHDLGTEKELDKCCRAHDHCPTKLKALRSGYGLINWSFYTKSHCECDSLLFDCLKKADTNPTAGMLGNFYFNILKVQCIDEDEMKQCAVLDEVTHQCRIWQQEPSTATNNANANTELPSPMKRMFFRNIAREF